MTISPGSADALTRLHNIGGHGYSSLVDIVTDFLSGSGIPNLPLAQSQGLLALAETIGEDLGSSDPSIRPRLFHRAATGSEALLRSTPVRVCFCTSLTWTLNDCTLSASR